MWHPIHPLFERPVTHVLLGAHGNITSRVAAALLERQQPVRVIGRNPAALASAAVSRVVNLSSVGAELPAGTGPIAGLREQEQRLNRLPGVDLLNLRPGCFMENHLQAAGTIAALGLYASLEAPDVPVPMVAARDIAEVAVRELTQPRSRGVLHLHAARHYSFRDAAAILGGTIGRPGLAYVQAEPAQVRPAMLQAGLSADAIRQLEEMARWLSASPGTALPGPVEVTPTTLEPFGPRFKAAFDSLPAMA